MSVLYKTLSRVSFCKKIRHPPALPCRLQHSTIGRLGLNRRVRDGNGCVPQPHRHRKDQNLFKSESFLIGSPKSYAFSRSRLRRLCSQSHLSAPESKLSSLLSDSVRAITHDSRRFNSAQNPYFAFPLTSLTLSCSFAKCSGGLSY